MWLSLCLEEEYGGTFFSYVTVPLFSIQFKKKKKSPTGSINSRNMHYIAEECIIRMPTCCQMLKKMQNEAILHF